ncbi:MAG TPA: hypothetical protein VKB76_02645 [Ktedonobacterales bacterium]|nr:hypothetical protein [Ktedonobacterales bacterium]
MSNPQPTPETPEITAAVQSIEDYWSEMARRWPWMLQQSLRPVYVLAGELQIALTRRFPAVIHSNQARWYARLISGTPNIYVLFPDQFQSEARKRLGTSDPHTLEGKNAVTFLYLANIDGAAQPAKTLLISTEQQAPMFRAQVAHELLNCACATDWDGHVLRAGVRRVNWGTGAPAQQGGMLNDLLIDMLLLDFLPSATNYTRASLLGGAQGPYWQIAGALSQKVPQPIAVNALFGTDADRLVLAGYLGEALERGDAAQWIDRQLADHRWDALAEALGSDTAESI